MAKLILYLLEASVTLVLLYTLYAVLLKRLTFFNLNRFFLLAILVFTLVIPLLSFDFMPSAESVVNRPVSELSAMRMAYYQSLDNWVFEARSGGVNSLEPYSIIPSRDMKQWLLGSVLLIYAIGVIALISRSIWTYAWMHRLRKRHVQEIIGGVVVVKLPYKLAPFSFLNAVFVPEETCSDASFDQILAHEKTHIDQRHSIDLIFVQLIAAFLWFNPVVWQLIKSLKATHEYIVDKQMINQGYSLVEYQTLLLRQLISNNSYGLVHNFNLSFIKKRITMMKVKESGWAGKVKVAAVFAAVVVFSLVIVQCNAKLEDQEVALNATYAKSPPPPISLPELADVGHYKPDVDLTNSMTFSLDGGVLRINGEVSELEDVAQALEPTTETTVMVLMIAKDQQMGAVRDLQDILRKNNRRKVLYRAVGDEQQPLDLAILLSPHPDSPEGANWPVIDEEFAKKNGTELLKVKVSDGLGKANAELVSTMVKKHITSGDDKYVVSLKCDDDASFDDYFVNLFYVYRGFDQIYDERAKKFFGKAFYDIDRKAPGGNEQYLAVRKGIPRAISIAERNLVHT